MIEILDIINDNNEIIGSASYEKIHKEKLPHRVVSAMLKNSKGQLLLQLRSEKKSAYPLHWSFSAGGHVRKGENYLSALIRETKEEVEIDCAVDDFIYKGKGTFVEHSGAVVTYEAYEILYDGPIEEVANEEVAAVQFADFPTIKKMIEEKKEKFQPALVQVLKDHWGKELGLTR